MTNFKKIADQESVRIPEEDNEVSSSSSLKIDETQLIDLEPEIIESAIKYSCTFMKFVEYTLGTPGKKNDIIRRRKRKGGGGYPWYHVSKRAIKASIINGNSIEYIQRGLAELKRFKPDPKKKNDVRNKQYSLDILRNFLNIDFDPEFIGLEKELIKPKANSLALRDVEIIYTDVIYFRSKYNEDNIVGAVALNLVLKPLKASQMKVASYMLKKQIEENILKEDEKVLPQFCISIDTTNCLAVTAPTSKDTKKVREIIDLSLLDFKKRW